jgi:hypothetical protein
MAYSTGYPLPKFWISRSWEKTLVLPLRLFRSHLSVSLLRSCSFLLPPMCLLALISIVYEKHQRRSQPNNNQAFQDPVINNIVIKPIHISTRHWIVVREVVVIIIRITVIWVIILNKVANPL